MSPSNVEELRCFVPAKDFAVAQRFYDAIGFRQVWQSDKLILFQLGRCSFFLQDYFVRDWAENTMLDLRVANTDAFFAHLQSLTLSESFPGVRLGSPQEDASTGIRRGHFVDPSGVLWHFSQSV